MLRLSTTIWRRVFPIRSQNATRLLFVYKSDVIGVEVYLDQTWQECSLGGPLQKLFTEFDSIKNSG